MIKELNVVSLFNGMNTGRQALENIGVNVGKYYSSEIKPYAIRLTQHHFPDTVQVGDVTQWKTWDIDWSSIDLILSGSPCQDLSAAGNRAGINGKKSSLFWVFIEILEHCKSLNPNVLFLQENVGSAPKLDVGIMSRALGVYPVRINSSLVTAQLRDRYYWSNIRTKQTMFDTVTDIPQPKDRGILFQDIITDGYTDREKAQSILQSEGKTYGYSDMNKFKKFIEKRQNEKRQICNIVYVKRNKALAILESESRVETGQSLYKRTEKDLRNAVFYNDEIRPLNQIELERLQGFKDGHTSILTRNKAASLLGDGWTLPVIEHLLSFLPQYYFNQPLNS
jgi:DNA-cytosine methyltransferase